MPRPKTKRPYALHRRKEKLEETRRRIVEAIVALHEELGPRHTTISGIAERAGVERLTVYRHFPDEAALFAACSAHWSALNPPPAPEAWAGIADPAARTRRGLGDLYTYFARSERMLGKIQRDMDELPALRAVVEPFGAHLRQLAADLAAAWPVRGAARTAVATVLGHAVQFSTWQTLGLAGAATDAAKAALVTRWVEAVAAAG